MFRARSLYPYTPLNCRKLEIGLAISPALAQRISFCSAATRLVGSALNDVQRLDMIPQPSIEWQEPSLFKSFQGKSAAESVRASIRIFAFVAPVGGCLFLWYLGKEHPGEEHASLLEMLTIGIAVGAFVAFAMPWLRANSPYRIGFYEKGFSRANRTNIHFWKYEDIAKATVSLQEHQNQPLKILTVYLKDGNTASAGIADVIQTDTIIELFRKHGINCSA